MPVGRSLRGSLGGVRLWEDQEAQSLTPGRRRWIVVVSDRPSQCRNEDGDPVSEQARVGARPRGMAIPRAAARGFLEDA
jgi:hypothetical protein